MPATIVLTNKKLVFFYPAPTSLSRDSRRHFHTLTYLSQQPDLKSEQLPQITQKKKKVATIDRQPLFGTRKNAVQEPSCVLLVDKPKISDSCIDVLTVVIKSPSYSLICDYTRERWLILVWPLLYWYTCTSAQSIPLTQGSRLLSCPKSSTTILLPPPTSAGRYIDHLVYWF